MANKQIPIIVINLKQDIAKKNAMMAMLNNLRLEFSFFEAVYGKNLTADELSNAYNPQNSIAKKMRLLTKPEIGCALSHLKIYQYILNNNIDKIAILEDDAIVGDDFAKALQFVKYLPKDWELLLLGHSAAVIDQSRNCRVNIEPTNNPTKFSLGKPVSVASGAYGYIINQKGAKKLLAQAKTLYKAIDDYTGNYKIINLYDIYPLVVTVDFSHSSTIQADEIAKTKYQAQSKTKKTLKQYEFFKKISAWNRRRRNNRKYSLSCLIKKLQYKLSPNT